MKTKIRLGVSIAAFFFASTVFSFSDSLNSQFLSRFGANAYQSEVLPGKFRLLVWNVFRGGYPGLAQEFRDIGGQADLVLFQEAIDAPEWTRAISTTSPRFIWQMAKSIVIENGVNSGVAIGSSVRPLRTDVLFSPVTEPIVGNLKSLLINEYALKNSSQTLLVANIHAINFVGQSSFEAHIDQLVQAIRQHRGPLIVAGDFNTWSVERFDYLSSALEALGLLRLPIERRGLFVLDHVFSRQVKTLSIQDQISSEASDHDPMIVDFEIQPAVSFFSLNSLKPVSMLISDIDDTLKLSYVRDETARLTAAFTTEGFLGMAELFRALLGSQMQMQVNYVSNAPSFLMQEAHENFLRVNAYPWGGVFLRESLSDNGFKLSRMRSLLKNSNPGLVILIGDNGERDPEIYEAVRSEFEPKGFQFLTYIRQVYQAQPTALATGQIPFTSSAEVALDLYRRCLIGKSQAARSLRESYEDAPLNSSARFDLKRPHWDGPAWQPSDDELFSRLTHEFLNLTPACVIF